MTPDTPLPFLLAMARQGQSTQSAWVSFVPFALIFLIVYVVVLVPMRRRQKKVQDFQAGLNVGDRVITTSGIYGQITKLDKVSVQIQIADKVKIEVARAAIGGYQGQDPVVQPDGGTL
jgi:preprotein translocase subunit YajC